MKRLSKFEITAGILGPILLPLFIYLYTFMFVIFAPSKTLNVEIEKELSRIKAKGEPVALNELAPPPIPESENAAVVYEKAFQKIGEIPEEVEDLLSKQPSELTTGERSALKDFLDKKEEAFSLIEKAITYKGCHFPIDYEEGLFVDLPHLSRLRDCARLLALKSLWELDKGNVEEALNTSLKMIKLNEALSREPFLISQLVRIAIGTIMTSSLEKVLSEGDVSLGTLKRLIEIIDTYQKDMRAGLKLAFLGERCSFMAVFQNPEKFLFKKTDVEIPLSKVKYFMGSRFVKSDELYGLKIYKKLIDFTQPPLHQAIRESKRLEAEVKKQHDEASEGIGFKLWRLRELHIFSETLLPSLYNSFVCWARHSAETQEMLIVAGLKIYRIEHGTYPEGLEDISLHILSTLPRDPFTGEDFIYRKEDNGFILYSVGENLKDDGGLKVKRYKGDYDIVWRCEK